MCFQSQSQLQGRHQDFFTGGGGTHVKQVLSDGQGGWERLRCALNVFAFGGGKGAGGRRKY